MMDALYAIPLVCNCPACRSEVNNPAMMLIDIAEATLHPNDELLSPQGPLPCNLVEVIALSLRLRSRPDIAFRAMVEGWDRYRIVRELY